MLKILPNFAEKKSRLADLTATETHISQKLLFEDKARRWYVAINGMRYFITNMDAETFRISSGRYFRDAADHFSYKFVTCNSKPVLKVLFTKLIVFWRNSLVAHFEWQKK